MVRVCLAFAIQEALAGGLYGDYAIQTAFSARLSNASWYALWKGARDRAKNKNMDFTITPQDVYDAMVDVCPVLGLQLEASDKCYWDNSPSLDRINSSKGYTPDNIWVISARANRIKSDATLKELKQLVAALEARHGHCP